MHRGVFRKIMGILFLAAGLTVAAGCREDAEELQGGAVLASSDFLDEQDCPLDALFERLGEGGAGQPYAYARILIAMDAQGAQDPGALEGTAHISWQTFQTAGAFQAHLEQAEGGLPQGYVLELAYYQYQLDEDAHADDIGQALKERFDTGEDPLYALTISDGPAYCFSQTAVRELVVKDHVLYGIECRQAADGMAEEDVGRLLMAYSIQEQCAEDFSGWVMDEEELYWIDHDERVTTLENPARSFTEVRGIDRTWHGTRYMENFALLKEAGYQIMLREDGPALDIHFDLIQDIPANGLEMYLLNGYCTGELYKMRVTDLDTGVLLQEMEVEMSVEMPDMITFKDLDGDGYLDMKIDKPTHWSGDRAVVDEFSRPSFLLWDPEDKLFVRKRQQEIVERCGQDRQTDEKGAVRYVVQPGDTLWGISRRSYGTGTRYIDIQEANADILSAYPYLMPGMVLELP